ncbi:hypothetical protein ZWY2020_050388 [Hordeum vulgare]|nr:hypothetical protein ZWY2020_050388 [Hordeum vulgare]
MVVFGLNALSVHDPDGKHYLGGNWEMTSLASFVQYTVNKGYEIHGLELGKFCLHHLSWYPEERVEFHLDDTSYCKCARNELNVKAGGTSTAADQYAKDVTFLKWVVEDAYEDNLSKPVLLASGSFFDEDWFSEFIAEIRPHLAIVVSHHIYNLGAGL